MKDLKEISARLEIAKRNIKKDQIINKSSNAASLGKALKISTELVAAVVVGTTLGFILDNWFDTRPWLTVSFFIIFFCYYATSSSAFSKSTETS